MVLYQKKARHYNIEISVSDFPPDAYMDMGHIDKQYLTEEIEKFVARLKDIGYVVNKTKLARVFKGATQ